MTDNDWFEALSVDVKTRLAEAFQSYRHAQSGLNSGSAPSVKETTEKLNEASELASKLAALLDDLSAVGRASIFEIAMKHGEELGRAEIAGLCELLRQRAHIFLAASDQIKMLHSPLQGEGQGSNSSMGRDADILAIRADHHRRLVELHYNQPKDLFGCAALAILYEADALAPPDTRGAPMSALARLQFIWKQHSNDPLPNWGRVIRDRKIIHRRTKAESEFWRDVLAAV